jgi:hypothetical protein
MTEPESLARVIEAHAARGVDLPTAVAHAVLVDLLEAPGSASGALSPADVHVDRRGRAFAAERPTCAAMLPLVSHLLGPRLPPDARPMLAVLEDLAGGGLPAEPERVRLALREFLPPPAGPEEVAGWVSAASDEPSDLPTLLPEDAGPSVLPTPSIIPEPPRGAQDDLDRAPAGADAPIAAALDPPASGSSPPASAAPSAGAHPERPGGMDEARSGRPAPPDPPRDLLPSPEDAKAAGDLLGQVAGEGEARRVVRHEIPRNDPPVSVRSAPAARRSARAGVEGDDAILGPGESRGWWMWAIVLAALAGAMYLLFFA